MKSKTFWVILLVLVVVVGGYFAFMDKSEKDSTSTEPVETEAEFDSKVVYTTDMSVDTAPLEADCELRGGEFNECGSVCEPGAEMCTEQCAYTCDNINPSEGVIDNNQEENNSTTSSATSSDEMTTSSATSTN